VTTPREDYLELLKERKKTSRAYVRHQSIGLVVADILHDRGHKTLYMKLTKEYDPNLVLAVAKDVAERIGVKNKGAYFMKIFGGLKKPLPQRVPIKKTLIRPKLKQLKLRLRESK